jgi:hypothetical protein
MLTFISTLIPARSLSAIGRHAETPAHFASGQPPAQRLENLPNQNEEPLKPVGAAMSDGAKGIVVATSCVLTLQVLPLPLGMQAASVA